MTDTKSHPSRLWKDRVDEAFVKGIAAAVGGVHRRIDQPAFVRAVMADGFFELELMDRINRIAHTLGGFLPRDFSKAVAVLKKVAPKLGEFENWVLVAYVDQFGADHFEVSVDALKYLTRYGTAEFAVRRFIINDASRMLPVLSRWAEDPNEHVRRLAAEGTRPRGVWTLHIEAFKQNPRGVLKLLEKLKTDDSLYVRKAVANNLNDISKDHPDLVIATVRRWLADGHHHTAWIVKRGCRGLIREGDPRVFPLLGFTAKPTVAITSFKLSPTRLKIGSDLQLSLRLRSSAHKPQMLAVDYRVHYVRPGGRSSVKLFKWSEKTVGPGETIDLTAVRPFRNILTRCHHHGRHRIELVINGETRIERFITVIN
jgi:3-methyladenine DNA glycosylase AlkC